MGVYKSIFEGEGGLHSCYYRPLYAEVVKGLYLVERNPLYRLVEIVGLTLAVLDVV